VYSFNLDYIFDKVYDLLLSVRYFWYFDVLKYDQKQYLDSVSNEVWDGLRDRGWFDASSPDGGENRIDSVLNAIGVNTKLDTDGDGISNIKDSNPLDTNNFSQEKIKEVFGTNFSFADKFNNFFGLPILDTDRDGVPDSYEIKYGMNISSADSDSDGILDSEEVFKGLNAMNADQDRDGILDGRDAYPTDTRRSVIESDIDSDGDGVGDRFENILGSNKNNPDTDGDGLRDGVDQYINNKLNTVNSLQNFSNEGVFSGLTFSVQNDILRFLADVISLLHLFLIPLFMYVFYKWYEQMDHDIKHYYHLFHDAYGYDSEMHGGGHNNHGGKHRRSKLDKFLDKIFGVDKYAKKLNYTHKESTHNKNFSEIKHSIENNENMGSNTIHHVVGPVIMDSISEEKDKRWEIVERYMNEKEEVFWRLGIIEADNMLDDAMKSKGYAGNSLGERMLNANFRTIDLAWDAHKIRNKIAHAGSNYSLTDREARRAHVMFETVLKELRVI
jgi:hypothetical protein